MKTKQVKELMLPLSAYATVHKDATLRDAVTALREAQAEFEKNKYHHRAVLVLDDTGHVVGKVSLISILRGLEPKYDEMLTNKKSMHLGFTRTFQKTMLEQLKLWDAPLEHVCRKAGEIKVETFMSTYTEGEYIEVDAPLDEAIHQLVMGHHQSLLVTEKKAIVGIVRLTDVFEVVADSILTCEV